MIPLSSQNSRYWSLPLTRIEATTLMPRSRFAGSASRLSCQAPIRQFSKVDVTVSTPPSSRNIGSSIIGSIGLAPEASVSGSYLRWWHHSVRYSMRFWAKTTSEVSPLQHACELLAAEISPLRPWC